MINKLGNGHNFSLTANAFLVKDFAQMNVFVWICTNHECVCLDMHRFCSFDNWLCDPISANWQLTLKGLKFVEKELGIPVTFKIYGQIHNVHCSGCGQLKHFQFSSQLFKEIISLHGLDFIYVPTVDNPADIATRGKTPPELSSSI